MRGTWLHTVTPVASSTMSAVPVGVAELDGSDNEPVMVMRAPYGDGSAENWLRLEILRVPVTFWVSTPDDVAYPGSPE